MKKYIPFLLICLIITSCSKETMNRDSTKICVQNLLHSLNKKQQPVTHENLKLIIEFCERNYE